MTVVSALDGALKAAGIPIDGVSVGVPDVDGRPRPASDKTSWEIQFAASATNEQKAAAQGVLEAFDPASVPAPARPMAAEDVLAILKRKGVITDADIATQRPAALGQRGTP